MAIDDSRRDALIDENLGLVPRIARYLRRRLPKTVGVEIDDLVGAGYLGLVQAAARYREDMGASFQTYSKYVIRGAMLETVRRRGHKANVVLISAEETGWKEPSANSTADAQIDAARMRVRLAVATASLPLAQRAVIELRYGGTGLSFAEVGQALGKKTGTIYANHALAILRLRARFRSGDVE